jgi:malate dehydrogenase (oxaloacetate-decarboxylating)
MSKAPIVFALSNPIPEIMPDIAKDAGAVIVATGRSDFPNQLNNALAFPGIFRGALDNNINEFTNEMLIRAAQNIADTVDNPTADKIIPSIFEPGLATKVAEAIK